ncbi:transaldolase [Limimonas halophila]|uniref:Probable transaldolase n=1 Tax=Limimonas halophila TaxID=1082479 RepID=A0A1G7UHY6_9PROT|nr:fructose-6-phosphate aldolase [Limimonas halophila]SDG46380.1 transaldolase [Limimonas halophila]
MEFFVDTADTSEIRELAATGLLDGVTTNPSHVAKTGRDMFEVIHEICELVAGPVSAEVAATDHDGIVAEGRVLAGIADNVVVKAPLTTEGLKATRTLTDEGIPVNVTLCFSAAQALLAAKAGARYVSPFIGRLDDIGHDGVQVLAEIQRIFDAQPELETEVLVASVRHTTHVTEAAKMGAPVATLPPKVLWQMFQHPLTDKGLAAFLADWEKTGQSIIRSGQAGA